MNNSRKSPLRLTSFQYNLLVLILISIVGLICYSNSFKVGFVFDDIGAIVENPSIKNIADVGKIWQAAPSRFITNLTFALNFKIGGLRVEKYHLFNFIIHIFTGFTLFLFVKTLTKNWLIPLSACLLFIAHPIQTEAITYINQRAASMAALFYLLSLLFYVKLRTCQTGFRMTFLFICLLISASLAFFTKENTYSLPLTFLLIEYIFFSGKKTKEVAYFIGLFFLLGILAYLAPAGFTANTSKYIDKLISLPSLAQKTQISRFEYFLTQINVVRTYIRLLFLPIKLNLDYDYSIYKSFWDSGTILSAIFLVSLIVFAFKMIKKNRLISFGILFFFIALSVESSIIPISDVIFEHRLYLSSVGFVIAVSSGLFYLIKLLSFPRKRESKYILYFSITFLLVSIYSFTTYQRNKIWQDEYSLWSDVVSKSPKKARPRFHLGMVYVNEDKIDQAINEFKEAVRLNPEYMKAYNNLGVCYEQLGLLDEAIENYQQALRFDPFVTFVRNNLADVYFKKGELNKSIVEYKKVLVLDPQNEFARKALEEIYKSRKQ